MHNKLLRNSAIKTRSILENASLDFQTISNDWIQ